MDLSFKFFILLHLNKSMDLKKNYIDLKKYVNNLAFAIKNFKQKKSLLSFFLRHSTSGHDTTQNR